MLLGYVDAVVEDKGPFSGQLHAAAAEGDAAIDAVAAAKRQCALPFVFGFEGLQAFLEDGCTGCVEKFRNGAPGQIFGAIAESLGGEGVQRGQAAFHGAGKHKAKAAFHDLTVAIFAGEERHFHLALVGDVLAADDQILDLAAWSLEGPEGPTYAPGEAAGNPPSRFVRAGDLSGRCFEQLSRGPGPVTGLQNFLDKGPAGGIGQALPGQLRAGVVQPHHAAGGVQHGNQRWNRVQRGGYKASFDGQRAFCPLPGPLCLLLGPDTAIELESRNRQAAQNLQQRDVFLVEPVRLPRQNRQRADNLLRAGDERRSGIGAARLGASQFDPLGRKSRILPCIVDQQRFAILHGPLAGG